MTSLPPAAAGQPPTQPPTRPPTLYVLIGLPGSGKTAYARQLARDQRVLRMSPDEWMLPLFGAADTDGKRDVLEGRLIATTIQVLRLGVGVVLDFGVWSRDERTALRALAAELGVRCRPVYLSVEPDEQWARVSTRFAQAPATTVPLTAADLAHYRELFQAPDAAELDADGPLDPPPAGYGGWTDWIAVRWPSALPGRTGSAPD